MRDSETVGCGSGMVLQPRPQSNAQSGEFGAFVLLTQPRKTLLG